MGGAERNAELGSLGWLSRRSSGCAPENSLMSAVMRVTRPWQASAATPCAAGSGDGAAVGNDGQGIQPWQSRRAPVARKSVVSARAYMLLIMFRWHTVMLCTLPLVFAKLLEGVVSG